MEVAEMPFEPITTQEQFDSMVADRLARQDKKIRAEYADYESLRQQVGTLTEAAGTHQQTVDALNAKIKDYELANLRRTAADKYGIPGKFASRIAGEDEKTIDEDAKALSEIFRRTKNPPDPGRVQVDKKTEAMKNAANALFG